MVHDLWVGFLSFHGYLFDYLLICLFAFRVVKTEGTYKRSPFHLQEALELHSCTSSLRDIVLKCISCENVKFRLWFNMQLLSTTSSKFSPIFFLFMRESEKFVMFLSFRPIWQKHLASSSANRDHICGGCVRLMGFLSCKRVPTSKETYQCSLRVPLALR